MRVLYNPESSAALYKDYYQKQVGNGLAAFSGARIQKGHGIGGVFASLLKGAMPLIKRSAKTVGKELLGTGVNLASDLIQGKNFKEAAKNRFKQTGNTLLTNLSTALNSPAASKSRRIEGNRKRKKQSRKSKTNKKSKRTLTHDIFS